MDKLVTSKYTEIQINVLLRRVLKMKSQLAGETGWKLRMIEHLVQISFSQELVAKFESGDFHIINGVLQTAHSLFKRFVSCALSLFNIMAKSSKMFKWIIIIAAVLWKYQPLIWQVQMQNYKWHIEVFFDCFSSIHLLLFKFFLF